MKVRDQILMSLSVATGVPKEEIKLDFPEREEFGDFSTNVALQIKNKKNEKKKNPSVLSENIIKKLKEDKDLSKIISKIEAAGPGFINFFLSEDALFDILVNINRQKDAFGRSDILKGKKIMFEFGQPNTHKLPHIGHLFSYIYGGSMTNILESVGAKLRRVNYQGDIGPHVAKCLWAYEKERPVVPKTLEEKVKLLQKMYQIGSESYDDKEDVKKEILEVNKKIYGKDKVLFRLWRETREWNIKYYKEFEKRLGIYYDRYYFESEVETEGKRIVEENEGKVFERSEGALIFKGSKYGLHDRVFVTKYGTPTYEAKDMYLQTLKIEEWPMDVLVITTAHEQNEYFRVVFAALEKLGITRGVKLKHIGFGMVNLKSGKMSSRTGRIISAIDLVNMVNKKVSHLNKDKNVAELVGMGAIKYSFLKNNHLQDTKFDVDESIASEGNSGPYLQYTYARTQSVLRKAKLKNLKTEKLKNTLKINDEEEKLLRIFVHFPEVIETVALTYSPNLLCNYLYNLAQKFNLFYNRHRILNVSEPKREFRLRLTTATGQIIKNGLFLLGIAALEKM